MKVFISMPMKSKSTAQVRSEMLNVFEYIKKRLPEAELIDSVVDGADEDIASKGLDKYIAKQIFKELDTIIISGYPYKRFHPRKYNLLKKKYL